VWAADRLGVWGGVLGGDAGQPVGPALDGAVFDVEAWSWHPMAAEPVGATINDRAAAIWTGTEVLLGPALPAADAADRTPLVVAYDPVRDTWRHLPAPYLDDVHRWQAVTLDGRVVFAPRFVPGTAHAGERPGVTVLDPATGDIRSVDPGLFIASPYPDVSGEVTLAVADRLLVATPNWDRQPWVLDPDGTGRWWQAAVTPPGGGMHLPPAVPMGDEVMYPSSNLAYDPADDVWRNLAANPTPPARWDYAGVWNGDEVLVPGAAYDPQEDRWRVVAPPPRRPDQQREGLVSAWTGDALLLFGGAEYGCPDTATCEMAFLFDTLDGWLAHRP